MDLVIIDTGCANLSSVQFAFERLNIKATISRDINRIQSADKLILPGVGAAEAAMLQLKERGLITTIQSALQPMLGICLGMQLMTEYSDEGNIETLKLISGKTELIPQTGLPLPHMGWNTIQKRFDHPLFHHIHNGDYFYFVHSYAVLPNENTMATCDYGVSFSAAISHQNFYGVQFHPERSGKAGAQLLKNFAELI